MIDELVQSQAGVLSRRQLAVCGATRKQIEANLAARRWRRVHDGVFATFTGPLPRTTEIWAALLAAGDGAVASHQTAAELWGLTTTQTQVVHVSIPTDRRVVAMHGVRVHRSRYLPHARHPVRSPPRTRLEATVVDLISSARSFAELVGWLTAGCQRRRTTPDRLLAEIASRSRVRWRNEAKAILADVSDGAETPLELEYIHRVERPHALPRAHRQRHRHVGKRTQWIDADYQDFRTRVELDGRIGHLDDGPFRDRRRDNAASEQGLDSLRYGWVEVHEESCGVAGQVTRVLQLNGWTGSPRPCGPSCTLRLATAA